MIDIIPILNIIVPPNRQRREFDPEALAELRISITESAYGLQHPIVIRRGENDLPLLVAGERRLRAASEAADLGIPVKHAGKTLELGYVPVVDLGDLDPTDAFEAELEENVRRADLTFIEQAQATARLLELRSAQAVRDGRSPPTVREIAAELADVPVAEAVGSTQTKVRDQLIVAKFAADPEVRKAGSLKEAVNIVKKREEQRRNVELAATHGAIFKSSQHVVENVDCCEWLASCPPATFDLIITDPPYGIGADQFGDSGKGVAAESHFYDDSYESWLALMSVFLPALTRAAKAESHADLFCDIDRFPELRSRMRAEGWDVHRTPIIWHNPDGFRAPWPEHGPQRKYELILYARRGGRKVNKLLGDVVECRKDSSLGHPAQKPVALLENLLQRSARPGDKVLDPFAGSGATIEACNNHKLACTALERDPGAYAIALKRLKALSSFDEGLF